jgi:GT2 family glycosyltransferase
LKTAVVILNWNGKECLEKFLSGVVENSLTTPGTEVIVADNGSIDDSVQWIQNNQPRVRLILFDKNYGFTGGYNRVLAQVEADYYVLLNSDIEVTVGWLYPLVELMDTDPDIGACMPKIKAYHSPGYFEYAGAAGGFIDKYGYPFCRGRILDKIEKDEGQYDEACEVFWATGACLMIRAKLYHETGGLDNDFFAHMEEIDLCWRLQRIGYKIMSQPQSVVYHIGGGALPNNSPRKLFLNYRNNLLMMYKNLPAKNYRWIIFLRMILDGLSACMYLLNFKFKFFAAVPKAYWAFYKMLPSFKNKRKQELTKGVTCKLTGIYKKSIVFRFYLSLKKLRFSDLKF